MNNPCVIIRLAGGLGNQLFMFAFAKALANRNKVPLKLDIHSGFVRDHKYRRSFILDHVLPAELRATRWESRLFLFGHTLRGIDRKINSLLPPSRRYLITERTFQFDPEIYNHIIIRPTAFEGYWQTPRYFDDLMPDMASMFKLPDNLLGPITDELIDIGSKENAVCLAIRRFEEVPNPKPHILQREYYQKAMERIEQTVTNPHYFVFTQDMQWARKNITSNYPITLAREKDLRVGAAQDLYLMTQCKHYILSNSSLHWWAAWLNTSPNKIVVSPAKGWPNTDLLLQNWILIA